MCNTQKFFVIEPVILHIRLVLTVAIRIKRNFPPLVYFIAPNPLSSNEIKEYKLNDFLLC